jgi:hypothetical protein
VPAASYWSRRASRTRSQPRDPSRRAFSTSTHPPGSSSSSSTSPTPSASSVMNSAPPN